MNLRTLDLNLLRVFDAIYGSRNVGAAAALLGMRQSAVSTALSKLREQVGDPLFVRAGQGVAPTPRAEAMAGPIRDGLARVDRALNPRNSFDPAGLAEDFRIGLHEAAEPAAHEILLSAIREQAPQMRFQSIIPSAEGMASDLLNGRLDLALDVTPQDIAQLHCQPLFRIRFACVGRRGWQDEHGPLTQENFGKASFAALKTQYRSRGVLHRALAAQGGKRRIVYETASHYSMASILTQSDLLAVMPRIFLDAVMPSFDLELIPLPYDIPDDAGYMIWHVRNDTVPEHRWLRRVMADGLARSQEGVGGAAA